MGYTVWHFVVDEVKGDLKRVPAVRWAALWNGEIPMPEWAGPEVRAIELALEVHRRRVQRLLRVLAHRMIVRSDGLHDVERELKRTTEVVWAAHDPIRALELDASRFWVPIEAHLIRLAGATDLPVHEIKAALVPSAAGNTGTGVDSLHVERGVSLLHALGAGRVGLGQVADHAAL